MSANYPYKVIISGKGNDFERTMDLIHYIAVKNGIKKEEADVIAMAIGEACENALLYCGESFENAGFQLELIIDKHQLKAVITSKGEPFDVENVEEFNINQDFMKYKDGGLGIPLMKKLMDEFQYQHKSDNTNEVVLIKILNKSE